MRKEAREPFLQSVYGKVIAAFVISVLAVTAASLISKLGFRDMLQTVESLSAPNDKLRITNGLFYRVTELGQLQHANAIENPHESAAAFEPEVRLLQASVDSLRLLCAQNKTQLARVDSMAVILQKRQQLSADYFALRAEADKNQELNSQVLSLTKKLSTMKPEEDKRVVTSTRKKTTTSLVSAKERRELKRAAAKADDRSFFKRLFAPDPEKKKLKRGARQVKEDYYVKVDTIYQGRKYHSILKVERDLRVVERDYHQRNAELVAKELALVKTNHTLNQQLLFILKDFEAEELKQVKGDYAKATAVVKSSVTRMNSISVVFLIGASLFAFLIVLDIARSNKLRKALQKAKEEAEHLGQVKQRFLANMSHELRTPLQSILGFSEQIKGQKQPEPEAVDAIFHSAEHLLQIVNEVLDYSRIVSGKFTFENKPFQVAQVAREVLGTLNPQAAKKALKLTLHLDPNAGHYVLGDAFRLRQVLYNLLGNAIKFTDRGEVSLTLKCSQVNDRALFSLKVKDTGIGIPQQDISRIFNQFEQSSGNDAQKHGGTGLGLSIARSLIESQGGQLTVSSQYGEGSVFEIQIPYVLCEKPGGLVYHAPEIKEASFNGEVLVVDDDAIILKLCGTLLSKHKIKNHCLRSPKTALETLWDPAPKLVFTDIQMPEMDGFELCRSLKTQLGAGVTVYAMTARALPEEHAAILAQGFDGILMKPFREQQMLQILQAVAATGPAQPDLLEDITVEFGSIGYICAEDDQMFLSMLELFITETSADLELLQLYLAGNQLEKATEMIHKLAGCVGQLGAEQLSEELKAQEQALKQNASLAALMPGLQHAISETEKFVAFAQRKASALQEA